jgi:hypothetical protein
MLSNLWDSMTGWLMGTGSGFDFGSGSDSTDSSGSPVFSYVILGAAVLLIVAMIFGELEDMAA